MKFRTEIKIKDAPQNLSPERLVLLTGSCFTDNIGGKMKEAGWPVIVNPCGVIYNPVSMALLYQLALTHRTQRRSIIESGITQRDDRFVTWFMSSRATGMTPEECTDSAMERLDLLEEGIEKADAVILTFGTSDVWLLKGTDRAVGNCHKHPAAEFEKVRISILDIVKTWKDIIGAVRMRNPEVKIILTVSPRRYLSESFADNTRQKAVLLLACEQLCNSLENVTYFPAYEIMNDDLRDYRFYKADLLHPSDFAVDYIWEKFCMAFLNEDAAATLSSMQKEARLHNHRPIM